MNKSEIQIKPAHISFYYYYFFFVQRCIGLSVHFIFFALHLHMSSFTNKSST